MQRVRDRAAGLNTAGFVSGYRGSPLGGLDRSCGARKKHLAGHHIGLPARPERGPRRHRLLGHAAGGAVRRGQVRRRVRHVVRQGPRRRPHRRRVPARQPRRHLQARRRAGADGRRPHCRSPRPPPHQSEYAFVDCDDAGAQSGRRAGDPRLRPLRLRAVALRRRVGRPQVREGHRRRDRHRSTVGLEPRRESCMPDDFAHAARRPQHPLARPHARAGSAAARYKLAAALAFARANRLDRIDHRGRATRARHHHRGKSYLDVLQALDDLGIDEARAASSASRSSRSA